MIYYPMAKTTYQNKIIDLHTETGCLMLDEAERILQEWANKYKILIDAQIEIFDNDGNHTIKKMNKIVKQRTIFLASPSFNNLESTNFDEAKIILENKNFIVNNQELKIDTDTGTLPWTNDKFSSIINGIKHCDIFIMLYYGNEGDSIAAWECGYAYSIGKPIVVVHMNDITKDNLMISFSSCCNIDGLDGLAMHEF